MREIRFPFNLERIVEWLNKRFPFTKRFIITPKQLPGYKEFVKQFDPYTYEKEFGNNERKRT